MKRLVVLVVFAAVAVMVLVGCGGGGIGTTANALPPTLFNAGVKKQIFFVAGGPVSTYNTSAELTSDGAFLSFTDKTGSFNSIGVSPGLPVSVPPQNAFTNQVAIPIAQIMKIVEFQ